MRDLINKVMLKMNIKPNSNQYINIYNRRARLLDLEILESEFNEIAIMAYFVADIDLDVLRLIANKFTTCEEFLAVDGRYWANQEKFTKRQLIQVILFQYRLKEIKNGQI